MFDERTDSCTHLLRQILANDLRQMQKIAKYQLPRRRSVYLITCSNNNQYALIREATEHIILRRSV